MSGIRLKMAAGAAAVAVAVGIAVGVPSAASAETNKSPIEAGYTIPATATSFVITSFALPTVDCTSAPDSKLLLGATFHGPTPFSSDGATVAASAICTDGVASYELQGSLGDMSGAPATVLPASSGDSIEIRLIPRSRTEPNLIEITDYSNSETFSFQTTPSDSTTLFIGGSSGMAGQPTPSFDPSAFFTTVDGKTLGLSNTPVHKTRQAGANDRNILSVSRIRNDRFRVIYRSIGVPTG